MSQPKMFKDALPTYSEMMESGGWKRRKVEIIARDKSPHIVTGWVHPDYPLCITEILERKKQYAITHIPSGLCIVYLQGDLCHLTPEQGKELIKILCGMIKWEGTACGKPERNNEYKQVLLRALNLVVSKRRRVEENET